MVYADIEKSFEKTNFSKEQGVKQMSTLNSIIIEGKLEIIENEGLLIVYQCDGFQYATKIDNRDGKFSEYENRKVRLVGKLLGNEIFIDHLEIKPVK